MEFLHVVVAKDGSQDIVLEVGGLGADLLGDVHASFRNRRSAYFLEAACQVRCLWGIASVFLRLEDEGRYLLQPLQQGAG